MWWPEDSPQDETVKLFDLTRNLGLIKAYYKYLAEYNMVSGSIQIAFWIQLDVFVFWTGLGQVLKIHVVGNRSFFSETAHRIFLIFCMKLGVNKAKKVTRPDFWKKISFHIIRLIMSIMSPKSRFFDF